MQLKEFKFEGLLDYDESDDFFRFILIDKNKKIDIVKKIKAIYDLFESEVSVSYLFSDEKLTSQKNYDNWVNISGVILADYYVDRFEHFTYFGIGDINLFTEFLEHKGKWCIIKVLIN